MSNKKEKEDAEAEGEIKKGEIEDKVAVEINFRKRNMLRLRSRK